MNELFSIYLYAFFLCAIASFTLSMQGAFMVARGESLQILALAQAALVGGLVGRLIPPGQFETVKILLFSWIFLGLIKLSFLKINSFYQTRETLFIVTYLALMSFSFFLISFFPALESHMAIGFFGDIVSLDRTSTLVFTGIFSFLGTILFISRKNIIRTTFEKTVLGLKKTYWKQEFLFATILVLSLYNLGLLFSITFMIFPAVLIGEKGKNLKQVFLLMGMVAVLASTIGLAASIWHSRLSTVPTQVLILLIVSLLTGLLCLRKRKKQYPPKRFHPIR